MHCDASFSFFCITLLCTRISSARGMQYSGGIRESRRCRCTNKWVAFGVQYLCVLCRAKQKPKCYTEEVVQQEHLCGGTELAWLTPPVPGAKDISVQLE